LALRAGLAVRLGAPRNGAPFKNWLLPAILERVRCKLKGSDNGDRQMVKVLSAAVLTDGLAAIITRLATSSVPAGSRRFRACLTVAIRRDSTAPPTECQSGPIPLFIV